MTSLTSRLLSAFRPQQRGLTPNQIFGSDWQDITGGTSGERVDQKTALTLSAVWSAVRLLSQDVATLPFHAIASEGDDRTPVRPQPTWIASPVPTDPNQTGIDYLSQVVVSLLLDGNAFILVLPDVMRPFELRVINPLTVEIKQRGADINYTIRDERNQVVNERLTALQMLHIPWVRKPGALRGMSPIEVHEETIGRGLAAQEISSRFFKQGHVFGGVIEVPRDTDMSKDDVKTMLAELNKRHGGHRRAWIPGALTGGASFRETTMKPADSQLLETEKWIREQVGSAFGIPPFLMGSNTPGAVSYASTEQQGILYKQSAVRPISTRIEKAHSRLLPPGQNMKFNLDGLLRADFKTRMEGYRELSQIGGINPDEIRAKEDMPPLPDGQGKHYWMPLNFAPVDQILAMPLPTDPAGARPDQNQENDVARMSRQDRVAMGSALEVQRLRQDLEKLKERPSNG